MQGRLGAFTAKAMVLDESWAYVGAGRGRKGVDLWVWDALAGVPFFITGDRGCRTFSYLWSPLPESRVYYTDGYSVYQVLDNHVVGKEYTYTVESYHSYCRAHLARLARDTRAVNRDVGIVEYSLALLNVMNPEFTRGRRLR
ncbi:hypothetical protein KN1_00250 [Stygiolobus caldivivus]|uniref:Uncharacterized protein n=1 Tax=Stygiolobus caldivivus TaxID=2824673 RepID=A0A8D5ZCT6_9CREN|nr:hypothetical protein KN1_00250 [Stygiolobus caldivivus]